MLRKIRTLDPSFLLILFFSLGSFGFVIFGEFSEQQKFTENPAASVDTLIPAGYVLVPIDIKNRNSLNSLLGAYGVVNLYDGSNTIATRVRIIRAPLDPNQFAVFITEQNSSAVVKIDRPLTVVLQNPKHRKKLFSRPKTRIIKEDIP